MPDIFISYSRKDSTQALALAERLRAEGMDIWIDQHGIAGAEQWARQIVDGINACSTFILLLSPEAVASENVLKELSLASEKHKRILPVYICPTELPSAFQYAVAGLQRVAISDFDAIVRSHKYGVERTIVRDTRKSLMVLPFEDLSPTQDNGWFADGIVSETISALGNVKALRLIDWNTSKEFKTRKVPTAMLAKELEVRYFLEGQVRKAGENIKVTVSLLDFETGDHLWQDSMKGTMQDIFDIQEKVAENVVKGLKLYLTADEKKKLVERGTENAEAYEIFLKADEYLHRHTKEGFQLAVQLISEAIKLDPGYAEAFEFKASALAQLYRAYDRRHDLLCEAETLAKEAIRLKPDLFSVYEPLSHIYFHLGQLDKAEEIAQEYIRRDPQNYQSHFTLGYYYYLTEQYDKAIAPYEQAVFLKPDNLVCLWNLVAVCDSKAQEKLEHWAKVALPYFERHLKLHPDDEHKHVQYASLLGMSGREDEAHAAAIKLTNLKDGASLYNTACLFSGLGDDVEALRMFRKSMEAGYRNIPLLKRFPIMNVGVLSLQGTPEYEEVKRMVEEIEAEAKQNT